MNERLGSVSPVASEASVAQPQGGLGAWVRGHLTDERIGYHIGGLIARHSGWVLRQKNERDPIRVLVSGLANKFKEESRFLSPQRGDLLRALNDIVVTDLQRSHLSEKESEVLNKALEDTRSFDWDKKTTGKRIFHRLWPTVRKDLQEVGISGALASIKVGAWATEVYPTGLLTALEPVTSTRRKMSKFFSEQTNWVNSKIPGDSTPAKLARTVANAPVNLARVTAVFPLIAVESMKVPYGMGKFYKRAPIMAQGLVELREFASKNEKKIAEGDQETRSQYFNLGVNYGLAENSPFLKNPDMAAQISKSFLWWHVYGKGIEMIGGPLQKVLSVLFLAEPHVNRFISDYFDEVAIATTGATLALNYLRTGQESANINERGYNPDFFQTLAVNLNATEDEYGVIVKQPRKWAYIIDGISFARVQAIYTLPVAWNEHLLAAALVCNVVDQAYHLGFNLAFRRDLITPGGIKKVLDTPGQFISRLGRVAKPS